MSETIIVAVIGAGLSLASFFLGKRAESQRQIALNRSSLLEPVSSWLSGAERMVGILGDTATTISLGQRLPVGYNMKERMDAYRFMSENTNIVMGYLRSKGLETSKTRKIATDLENQIKSIDNVIRLSLLPLESALVEASNQGKPIDSLLKETGATALLLQEKLQISYSLVAKLKTMFS